MPKTGKVGKHRAHDLKEIIAQFEEVFPTTIMEGVSSYLKAKEFKALKEETPLLVIYVGGTKVTNYDVTLIDDRESDIPNSKEAGE